jgi:DNA (cytosine-5)-methyltransferase 1
MFEIVKTVRPTWILAENVAGHIKLGLDEVLTDLETEGYTSRAIVIPACAKDAPHRRDRVWIIANTGSKRGEGGEQKQIQRIAPLQRGENGGGIKDRRVMPDLSTPQLCGTGDGIPNRLDRTRGLGNAIVPQVAHEIIKSIITTNTK